ncbi:MAG: ATP-binding protein, partial [Ekhidna sp.]
QLDGINAVPVSTNLDDVIKSNLDLYKGIIDQKKINTHVEIQSDAIAFLDANHLKIGVRNMIHNSLKFMDSGGTLNIRAAKENSNIMLEIEDNGIGMDPSKIESILSKELQSSKSGTAGEAGTGLGLSFSLELLEKNNCEVKIESRIGKGTKVIISMIAYENTH